MDVPAHHGSAGRPGWLTDGKLGRPGAAGFGPRRVGWARRAVSFASVNAMLFVVAAAYLGFWSVSARWVIGADSWMTFNDGREVVERGIPHHVSMTIIGHGATWVDQQWLAQIVFWSVYRLGGIQLSLLCTCALLLAPLMFAMTFAQRRGASVAMMMPFVLLPLANFTSLLRAQVFSPILFVVVVAVLAAESRRRSWRAFALLPVLVLWANLHGAVILGAALVSLLGLTELPGALMRKALPSLRRASALIVLPPLCLIATPYGLGTLAYYHATISNHTLHEFEAEWQPPTFMSLSGFPLFVLAATTLILVVKRRHDLTAFEIGTLAVTLVGALLTARSIPWFLYASVMLIPPLAQRAWRQRNPAPASARAGFLIAAVATIVIVWALASIAMRPTARLEATWPRPAAAMVNSLLERDPRVRVFASYEYADWLLFTSRAAHGRVAFNGHLELLTEPQLRAALNYLSSESGSQWQRIARGYSILVLNPHREKQLVSDLRRDPSTRVIYSGSTVIVLERVPAT
jgi:hypothetical protein